MNASMPNEIGKKTWVITESSITTVNREPEPGLISHETASILNVSDKTARLVITLYFSDREPAGPYEFEIPPRRTKYISFNDLNDPEPIPRDTVFSIVILADIPVVVQHARLNPVPGTITYAAG